MVFYLFSNIAFYYFKSAASTSNITTASSKSAAVGATEATGDFGGAYGSFIDDG
jgi:hypothetical protein